MFYLVEEGDQLAALHGQVVLVLGVVAVEHDELAEGVLEEGVHLGLGRGLGQQGAAPGLPAPAPATSAADVELEAGVLEAVGVALLQSLVHCNIVSVMSVDWI